MLFFFLSARAYSSDSAFSVTDARGYKFESTQPIRRIVPLYPAFSSLVRELGASDCLVARTKEEKTDLPSIGTHMRPNIERILAQKPDVVLQLHGRADAAAFTDTLRKQGLIVLELSLSSFADLWHVTEVLGKCLGKEERAKSLVASWQARLAAIKRKDKSPVRVFFEIRYPNLLAAGTDNIISEIIACAGGVNVVTTKKKVVRISEEALFALKPDVYIVQKGPMNTNPVPLSKRAGYEMLRLKRIYFVPEERFSRPGPNSVDACEELAKILWQE